MIQTDVSYEITDTFGGEANYSWVKRGKIECKPGENYADVPAIRRVKKAIGWTGIKCKWVACGEEIWLYPVGLCQVCFISFHPHGSIS